MGHVTQELGTQNMELRNLEHGLTTYEIRVAGGSSIQGRCASTERPEIRYTPFRARGLSLKGNILIKIP